MNKKALLIGLIAIVVLGAIAVAWSMFGSARSTSTLEEMHEADRQEALSKKISEGSYCGTTNPPHCFKYRCDTGYIYAERLGPPGGPTLKCTDGSSVVLLEEVPANEVSH